MSRCFIIWPLVSIVPEAKSDHRLAWNVVLSRAVVKTLMGDFDLKRMLDGVGILGPR